MNTGGLTNITTRLHLISRHRSKSLESKVDYTHPIVYSEIDSALSYPCERNSVALQNMAGAWSSRKRRDHDYEVIKSKALVIIDKGKVDAGLAERVRVSPAFIAPLPICTAYGPDGYPSTIFHLMASGNYFDGNMLPPAGVGTGLVG